MCWSSTRRWLFALLLSAVAWPSIKAQAPGEGDEEVARQRQIVERFVAVLERNPRRGTALDKIYGFHIENGSIEEYVKQLRDRVAAKPDDGAGWLILGLVESQRSRDSAAVEALTKASELRPTDAIAAYYLGQSLVLVGQPEKAAAAFEEAIRRRPAQVDLLEIFQALGRVYQRAQRSQEALQIWKRLEDLFPGDARVQEQIAVTLAEEGQTAEALPRYESLAKTTSDDYRRTVYKMEAADLKVRLNRASEGVADLEQLLARLNPESWLFREVRRKIEEVYLRTDDQDGLAKYYAAWLAKNPEDVEGMARLARVLARQSRVPEAQQWLDKALKLAPSRKDLRLAFIEQLVDDQRYREAAGQYAELDKADPNNPDYLRDWGKLILRDGSRGKEERQAEAERIWRRLLAARPDDPLIATQLADLFRHAEMQPQALALYQKAVELAPASSQYREYLGEYLHILKRPDEALAAWRQMADGQQRTATNLARLAEVLAQFGYLKEALPEVAAACDLEPKDFALAVKAAELQVRGEQHDLALASLSRAEDLSQNDEERELVLTQQIKTYALQNKLADLADALAQQAARGGATHRQWLLLARYREALHEYSEATKAISEALKLEASHIPTLAAAARIFEQAGDLKGAADLNRKLAVVDRRGRSNYLEHVAGLESQLGRIEEALAAGRELIAATPGNVETYQFFADLCFRLGRTEDGLTALRRATRVNPSEPKLLNSLASALTNQFRSDEAIELYWQAYDKERELDDKLGVIAKLTELYLQTNHLDKLLERLDRNRREADQRREMTLCLAQAYQSAGDYGMARQELERLLTENTRDTQLLQQLSKLAETEADLPAAVKYQEQLAKLAPGAESEYRLAQLLSRVGDNQEAAGILVRLAVKENDQAKVLRNIDTLMGSGQEEMALSIVESKVRENPNDWELLYRHGVALAKRNPAEAARRFEAILSRSLSDEELSTAVKAAVKRPPPSQVTGAPTQATLYSSSFYRLQSAPQIRIAVGAELDRMYFSLSSRSIWMPQTFGQARIAAIGWLYRFATEQRISEEFVAERRKRSEAAEASPRELWDWLYLQTIRSDSTDMRMVARRLAELGDFAGQAQFLDLALSRNPLYVAGAIPVIGQPPERSEPLEPEELELVLRSYKAVQKGLESHGQETRFSVPLLAELRRAGRAEEADRIYDELTTQPQTPRQLSTAILLASERGDTATALALIDRMGKIALQAGGSKATATANDHANFFNALLRVATARHDQPAELLGVLDRFLDYQIAWANQRRDNPLLRLAASSNAPRSVGSIGVSAGGTVRRVTYSYPMANAHYDTYAIATLRTLFEHFKLLDLVSDFQKRLEQRAAAAAGDKLYCLLAVAYSQVWNEDQETALKTLAAAIELVPSDAELRLETARLYVQAQQYDEALSLVDSIAPLDQRTLQQRETLALDMAVRLGDHQRARDAAQRLFGLRLDAETQVTLAGQMRRLGMTDEANAILTRSQRQAGSRLPALAALMAQYQEQGQMNEATQVAQRIIRATRTPSTAQTAQGISSSDSQYRNMAIQTLSKSGKLKEMIKSLEDQIERTPTATTLYETLAEYYQLAGDVQKGLDLTAKLVALRPDDAETRYRYAQDLYRRQKFAEACEQYKVVLKKQPQLLSRRYFEVTQAFQRAGKEPELVAALGEIDLKALGQTYMVTSLIGNMVRNTQTRPAGLALFKRAWEAFPADRLQLMNYLSADEAWKLPEVMSYARQALLPTADQVRRDPWYGIYGGISVSSDGRVTTAISRLLASAASQPTGLAELHSEVAAKLQDLPKWSAGPVLLALIDLRNKKAIDAAVAMKPLLDLKTIDSRMMYVHWIVGQELQSVPAARSVAIQLYERAARDNRDFLRQFQFSPAPNLVRLYLQDGRKDEARQFLQQVVRGETSRDTTSGYPGSIRADSMVAVGKLFEEIGAPGDALKTYREVLTNPVFSDPANLGPIVGGQPYYKQQAQQATQSLISRLGNQPTNAIALITPATGTAAGGGVIDLMLGVGETNPGPLRPIESPITRVANPTGLQPESVARVETHLNSLLEKFPRDLSVQIVAAFFALKATDAAKRQEAVARLVALVDQSPLEELAARQRPNSRQRAEAAQQVGLWLVARECLKLPGHREQGDKLAQRAIAAAQRQVDPALLTSILFEHGRLALDAGDRAAAERGWSDLIDLTIVQPRAPKSSGPQRSGPLPATTSQFVLAATIAQAAAQHDLPALSLKAMREVLSGGAPVPDPPKTPNDPLTAARLRASAAAAGLAGASTAKTPEQEALTEFVVQLSQLSTAWRQHQFPAAEVSQLLEAIVFPAARPTEIVLYELPQASELVDRRSIGKLLVDWASRADRGQQLAEQIAARQATPADRARGHTLLTRFYVTRHAANEARPHLEAFVTLVDSGKTTALSDLAAQAAAAAISEPQLVTAVAPLLARLSPPLQSRVLAAAGANPQVPATILARLDLQRDDLAGAKSHVDRFLQVRKDFYAKNSSETNNYYQRLDRAWAANELSRAGDLATTLDALAVFADLPQPRDRDGLVAVALWHLKLQIQKLSPQERYERLRDWTLPAKGRLSVRVVASFDSGQPIPQIFLRPGDPPYEPAPRFEPLSNLTLLIDAAKEAGKLEELWQAVLPLSGDDLARGQALEALGSLVKGDPAAASVTAAALARGDALATRMTSLAALVLTAKEDYAAAAPRLEAIAARIRSVVPEGLDRNARPPLPAAADYLAARAGLAVPELAGPASKLAELVLEQARKTGQKELIAHLGYDLGRQLAAPTFQWWQPATGPRTSAGTYPPALWTLQNGELTHQAGCEYDALYFKQPLTGEFEFSYETLNAYYSQCDVGYGGQFCFLQYFPRQTVIMPVSRNEQLTLAPQTDEADGWNRVTVKVSPAKVQYLVNDRLAYEETTLSRTSPWLHLHVLAERLPKMRNLHLRGTPTVPREVPLNGGDRLDGWNAGFYGETLPMRFAKPTSASSGSAATADAASPQPPDWIEADGVLEGRLNSAAGPKTQSRIFYHRPLAEDDKVRYQFFYEPGVTLVHPALGRIAFVLAPAGMRLHWMTPASDANEPLLIDPANAVEDQASRRGPATLPLKASDWNDVELSVTGGVVSLKLNGALICERPIEPTSDRRFGFFRYRDEAAAKVRNVVLSGNWRTELTAEDLADLWAVAAQ